MHSDGDLTTCIGCGKRVPRATTDITECGERCQRCSLSTEIAGHLEAAAQAEQQRGRVEGTLGTFLIEGAIALLTGEDDG